MKLIEELEQADAVLIGAPMYNYSIPSTLKAWLDRTCSCSAGTAGETLPPRAPRPIVVASRGGSYAPGTPREDYVRTELPGGRPQEHPRPGPRLHRPPNSPWPPAARPCPNWSRLYEASRKRAFEDATTKAEQLAERLAA